MRICILWQLLPKFFLPRLPESLVRTKGCRVVAATAKALDSTENCWTSPNVARFAPWQTGSTNQVHGPLFDSQYQLFLACVKSYKAPTTSTAVRSLAPHEIFSKQFMKLSFLCDNLTSWLQPGDWKLESCKNATSNARCLLKYLKFTDLRRFFFRKPNKNTQNCRSPGLGLADSAGRRGQGTTSVKIFRFSNSKHQISIRYPSKHWVGSLCGHSVAMAAVWTNTLVMLNGPSFLSDTIFVWRKDNTLQKGSGEKRSQREHWWRVFSLFKFDFLGNQIMLRTSMIPSRQRAPQVASSLIAKLLRLNGPGQRWSKLEILSSKWKQNFCNFTAGFIRTSLFFSWQNRVVWVKPPLYRTSNQGFVKMDSNLFKQLIFSDHFLRNHWTETNAAVRGLLGVFQAVSALHE